jgi:hypothetical protein
MQSMEAGKMSAVGVVASGSSKKGGIGSCVDAYKETLRNGGSKSCLDEVCGSWLAS